VNATSANVHPVSGPLTFASVPDLYAASRAWFAGGSDMVIDLAQVTQADSAGLALLIEWLRQARQAGAPLTFSNIPPQMLVLIRVNGLQDTLLNGKVA
jgi:phospholipid transport system transporter-binding protein